MKNIIIGKKGGGVLILIFWLMGCVHPRSENWWTNHFDEKRAAFENIVRYRTLLMDKYQNCKGFTFTYTTHTMWQDCTVRTDTNYIPDKMLSEPAFDSIINFMSQNNIATIRMKEKVTEFVFFAFVPYEIAKVDTSIELSSQYRHNLQGNYYILPSKDSV